MWLVVWLIGLAVIKRCCTLDEFQDDFFPYVYRFWRRTSEHEYQMAREDFWLGAKWWTGFVLVLSIFGPLCK